MNSSEIELQIADYFGIRQNVIIPNVSWGFVNHECDLLVLSKAGYATEIEIKISAADLKNDLKKRHLHFSDKIKYLYFAIPHTLLKYISFIPLHAGILVVYPESYKKRVFCLAKPEANRKSRPLNEKDIIQITRLGCIRIWSYRRKNNELTRKLKTVLSKHKEKEELQNAKINSLEQALSELKGEKNG